MSQEQYTSEAARSKTCSTEGTSKSSRLLCLRAYKKNELPNVQ